ncbi:TolC family protein [Dyella flava]|uniref:TolC family protein n=1 Tax=Dyella flava TaxID=1920170 RepID=A0ABS2K0T6_9GAMM|nr:TolC family protein [Dyella flava]MBM7124856.1 TolC family protein [Dyella flava]GLQ50897.1 transporter [Dyella flava]
MLISLFTRRAVASGLAVVLGGTSVSTAYAADPPLTLETAVQEGMAQAPALMAHHEHVASMHEEAARAGRLPDPTLDFGTQFLPIDGPGAFSVRSDPMTMRVIGFTQALPSRAARSADREAAEAEIKAADAEGTDIIQSIQERIADAWIDLWAAQQKRALLSELRTENALAVQIAQARLKGGGGSATDALAARAEAAALDNRLEAADADIAVAQAGLQRWLGYTATDLGDAPDFGHLPVTPDHLDQAIDQQAPMQVWEAREQVAQAALDRARASKHPDWSVSFLYGQRAGPLSDMVMLQFGVTLPLFTRNRQDRAISAKEEQWEAAQDNHEDARREQRALVARTVASWQGWAGQIQRYQDTLLPLDRDRTKTALAAYRGGAALQPWLDARRDEIELRMTYVDALTARARLWASLAYLLPTSEAMP